MPPSGAIVSPSGSLSAPPLETVWPPPPTALVRVSAPGTAAIRLPLESATYRTPPAPRPTPVGPTISAFGSVCSAKPVAITVFEVTLGTPPGVMLSASRTTVPRWTTLPLAATVPLSTFVTNRVAWLPWSTAVMSHGPLMSAAVYVATTRPRASSTVSAPARAALDFPPGAGRLPTTTNPSRSATSAVVKPTAGVDVGLGTTANTRAAPEGDTSTMLDPVPCSFLALLKLLTRTSPLISLPSLRPTTATP